MQPSSNEIPICEKCGWQIKPLLKDLSHLPFKERVEELFLGWDYDGHKCPKKKEDTLHYKLIQVAHSWVLKNASCGVAFKELNSLACNGEYPDVIGFGSGCHSVLVEVKTSRNDYLADKKKHFRQYPEFGMGSERFYCCPTGLIKKEELPEHWGLIYVSDKLKATCVYNPYRVPFNKKPIFEKNIKAEHNLMYSALRRLHIRGRIEEIYSMP